MNIEEIRLQKMSDGTKVKHHLYVKSGNKHEEMDLNEDNYKHIFEKIRPNNTFSTPDTLVQGFLQNTKMMPTFLNNNFFSNAEFNKMLNPIKKEMNHVIELNCPGAIKKNKKYFKNNKTKKKKKATKLERIRKIYNKSKPKLKFKSKSKSKSKSKTKTKTKK